MENNSIRVEDQAATLAPHLEYFGTATLWKKTSTNDLHMRYHAACALSHLKLCRTLKRLNFIVVQFIYFSGGGKLLGYGKQ